MCRRPVVVEPRVRKSSDRVPSTSYFSIQKKMNDEIVTEITQALSELVVSLRYTTHLAYSDVVSPRGLNSAGCTSPCIMEISTVMDRRES